MQREERLFKSYFLLHLFSVLSVTSVVRGILKWLGLLKNVGRRLKWRGGLI